MIYFSFVVFCCVTFMPYRSLTEALMAKEAGGTQPIQSSRGKQGHAPTALVTLQVNTGRQHRAKQPAHTKLGQVTVHKNMTVDSFCLFCLCFRKCTFSWH